MNPKKKLLPNQRSITVGNKKTGKTITVIRTLPTITKRKPGQKKKYV